MHNCPHLAAATTLLKSTGRYAVSRIQTRDCKVAYAQVMLLFIDMLERSAYDLESTRKNYLNDHADRQVIADHISRYRSNFFWTTIRNSRYDSALLAKTHAEEVINSVYTRFVTGGEGSFDHMARKKVYHTYKNDEFFN